MALGMALATMIGSQHATAQPNIIVNGNFETNPPTTFGNHQNYSIAPWMLTAGSSQPNVVQVDGPGGANYGNAGPQSDASAPGGGIPQHYLDIVGTGTLYQSFTPQCDGQVTFGGAFSTRDNAAGTGSIRIVQATTPSGPTVGTPQSVNLPAGNSMTAPWQTVSASVPVVAGTTYSFVVTMNNSLNFDNGFVTYNTPCQATTPEPCCPPFNETVLQQRLFYQGTGSFSAPYTVNFQSNTTLNSQMQAYVNYLATLGLGVSSLTVTFTLHPSGTGAAPGTPGAQQSSGTAVWTAGGTAPSITSFFPAGSMQVGTWYTVRTVMSLNNGVQFIPEDCIENSVAMRVQFVPGAPQGGQGPQQRGQASPLQFYQRQRAR